MSIHHTLMSVSNALVWPLAACAACATTPELRPAATAMQARDMDNAVMANDRGVQVTAQFDAWPGNIRIENEVMPLKIVVRNLSSVPLQVRYAAFKLTTVDGTTYHAIPPREVEGHVEGPGGRGVRPGFTHEGFYAAPYYGSYYEGIQLYSSPFEYDPVYYDTYYPYWNATTQLPTAEMLSRAMPEGVLSSGGLLDGFLYFEHVKGAEGSTVTLHADLRNADNQEPFVSVQLPFVVN